MTYSYTNLGFSNGDALTAGSLEKASVRAVSFPVLPGSNTSVTDVTPITNTDNFLPSGNDAQVYPPSDCVIGAIPGSKYIPISSFSATSGITLSSAGNRIAPILGSPYQSILASTTQFNRCSGATVTSSNVTNPNNVNDQDLTTSANSSTGSLIINLGASYSGLKIFSRFYVTNSDATLRGIRLWWSGSPYSWNNWYSKNEANSTSSYNDTNAYLGGSQVHYLMVDTYNPSAGVSWKVYEYGIWTSN